MNLGILACGNSTPEEFYRLKALPELRRATTNMLAVSAAIERLAPKPEALAGSTDLGVVIGTSHGELEPTVEFLRELGATRTARPFLFQNSLHNATLGFLTQRYALRGAGFTVSRRWHSGEDALELAADLLHTGTERVLVIGVDGLPPGLEGALAETYPQGTRLRGGAGALLLGLPEKFPDRCLAVIDSLEFLPPASAPSPVGQVSYDSDAVELLAQSPQRKPLPDFLDLVKPDGSATHVRFRTTK